MAPGDIRDVGTDRARPAKRWNGSGVFRYGADTDGRFAGMDRGAGASDQKIMTAMEIEKAVRNAGFGLTDAETPDRLVFTRGPNTLIVKADATWVCQSDERGRTMHGYTFGSLLEFLDYLLRLERRTLR